MDDNTTNEGNLPEDNQLISGLRADLKDALRAVKTAGSDALEKVKRDKVASSLMPEGFEGFADIFATEVDGDLTQESAAEWLKARGFAAPSEKIASEEAAHASALEEVTNLGGAVAAAGNLTPEDNITKQLQDIQDSGEYKTLPDLTAAISKVLDGQSS